MTDHGVGNDGPDEGADRRQGDEERRAGVQERAPNPTQERIDREGADQKPADVSWSEDAFGDTDPESTA
jgi:hypothetical protein